MQYQVQLTQLGKNLILIGVVAGAYFLLGLLGLLFRVPTDPVSVLMPSAGLALAATLLYGMRILPAVAIGNFCTGAWLFDFNQSFTLFYAGSAFGASMSALSACFLIQKLIGYPNPLLDGRQISKFMLLGGPVAGLLSATVGTTALHSVGIIALADFPVVWLTWWIADILGVMIFTPLFLIVLAEPHHIWFRRRTTVGLPILLTFALVVVLFFYLNSISQKQQIEKLKEKTITLSEAIKNRIQSDLVVLHGLRNFALGTQNPGTKEFMRLSEQLVMHNKEMVAIYLVKADKNTIDKKQLTIARNNFPNNQTDDLQVLTAGTKKIVSSSQVQSGNDLMVAKPNYLELIVPITNTIKQDKSLLGVISAKISMEELISQTLDSLNVNHCTIIISAPDLPNQDSSVIYSNVGKLNRLPYHTVTMPILGQTWQIQFYHDWQTEEVEMLKPIGWVLFIGLCFTGILGVVLLHLTGRYFRTEAIIEERTKVLTETKIAAEQANQAKNQFLAKISHELRTPLNGISGFAQLLEKKTTINNDDKKQVAVIRQCSDDLLKLINDILDISAIETRQIKLEISEFNFARLLNDVIRVCKLKSDEKKLSLIAQNTCLPRTFLGDEKRLRQILVNLIDNAIKYTHQGNVAVTAAYLDGVLTITVADTGCGISKLDLECIFTPFVQVNSDTFVNDGIGLGLAITHELVQLMDGNLSVTSQPGQGSIFTVRLPLPVSKKNQVKVMSTFNEGARNFSEVRILVVDDSEINLVLLSTMLEQLGCNVDTAMDGQAALELIKQCPYDLALIDINMPVMNGLELVTTLRSQQYKLNLAAVSAYADNEKINQAFSAGFDSYLTKPIEEAELVELIQSSLS